MPTVRENKEHIFITMRSWCKCDSMFEDFYHFHVAPNQFCSICQKDEFNADHYHCGYCLKLSQVG
ncbi:MAG: hypothetical protein Ct9H300mP11_00800 [Chloroflexota bacterium]|nr:MAG: hypothetical protein CM1200mP27_02330 [Chloroflexota bacterium]GIT42144.1 MAG: hypothetical protein Ct9H300mP11_00800 [Chloroflexota bacterium]